MAAPIRTSTTTQSAQQFRAPPSRNFSSPEVIALLLSLLWIVMSAAYFFFVDTSEAPDDPLRVMMTVVAVFLPVAVIWVGAATARSARIMREEATRLQAAIDGMRKTYLDGQRANAATADPAVARKLDEIAAAQKQTESAIVTFTSSRERRQEPVRIEGPVDEASFDQTKLELGTTAEDIQPPILRADFIRAVNFPENPEDNVGFGALRRALKDRKASKLIQAAQDVLTLMSQDGIYMDDLRPDRARPEIWRKFANGDRGPSVSALGGIRDRSSLALTSGRMRQDPVFRDTVHHFLRQFDKSLIEFCEEADDTEVAALSETRSARAFMLLGRVAGTFD